MSGAGRLDTTSFPKPKRPLVLVVDDDDAIREALSDLLEDVGFTTISARHGLEALKFLATSSTTPTLILLDLTMPIMDGWAFCRSRWKSRTLREIPVILISAVDLSETNRPTGVDAFLWKPIDADEFVRLAVRMSRRSGSPARAIDVAP
jgi:CheY-like chemotaxis protein